MANTCISEDEIQIIINFKRLQVDDTLLWGWNVLVRSPVAEKIFLCSFNTKIALNVESASACFWVSDRWSFHIFTHGPIYLQRYDEAYLANMYWKVSKAEQMPFAPLFTILFVIYRISISWRSTDSRIFCENSLRDYNPEPPKWRRHTPVVWFVGVYYYNVTLSHQTHMF